MVGRELLSMVLYDATVRVLIMRMARPLREDLLEIVRVCPTIKMLPTVLLRYEKCLQKVLYDLRYDFQKKISETTSKKKDTLSL